MSRKYSPKFNAGTSLAFKDFRPRVRTGLIFFVLFSLITWHAEHIGFAAGSLDYSFGVNGKTTIQFPKLPAPVVTSPDVAIQSDGKYVLSAFDFSLSSNPDFLIARINLNGSLDTSFGGDGRIYQDIPTTFDPTNVAEAVALQPDGKILVGGFGPGIDRNTFAITRHLPDGSLDLSFDGDGIVTTAFGNADPQILDLMVQSDGKIIALGHTTLNIGQTGERGMTLARYNTDGSLDTTFDGDGKIITNALGGQIAEGAIQPDGKIVVAGRGFVSGTMNIAVVRFNTDGSFDTSFDSDGVVNQLLPTFTSSEAIALELQPDGKILIIGTRLTSSSNSTLFRYNPDGSLDTTFGGGDGIAPVYNVFDESVSAITLAVQPNGRILVGGTANSTTWAVARFNQDGSVDSSFGLKGLSKASFGGVVERIDSMAIQGNKLITVGGVRYNPNPPLTDVALVRYILNNKISSDFDGDGKSDISVFRPSEGVWYLDRSSEGFAAVRFGLATDKIAQADFDGDGKSEVAVFRDGVWYWLNSSTGSFRSMQFGQAGDLVVPADYTGDGQAELAVFRDGYWYTFDLTVNQYQVTQFGITNDIPVPADFDGDGKIDFAVYRNGTWYWLGSTVGFKSVTFGNASDKPTVGDYDGDTKADPAVYRDGVWYLLGSTQGMSSVQFGITGDIPVPADFDGDGKTDISVFRNGNWYSLRSQQGFHFEQFGTVNDTPTPAAFLP